jgi:hypothetical protein
VGGVVVEGHGGEVGVGELEVRDVGAVDLELDLVGGGTHVDGGGVRGGEVLHGVVEVELLNLGPGGDRLLDLGHDHVLGLRGEHLTLLRVEVRVVGVDLPLARDRLRAPGDANLDVMVLEGDEGEGGLPVLAEGEAEGVELGGTGTVVETTGDGLGGGVGGEGGSDESGVDGVLLVDDLTTDEKLNLGDGGGPIGVRVRDGNVGTVDADGHEVDVVEHVTLALEANGGHAVVRDVALNDLTLDSLGKVRVTLVGRTEKADFGLTDEVHILSTDSDELGDTTRHFILYGDFIFKWEREQSTKLIGTGDSWLRYERSPVDFDRDGDLQTGIQFVRRFGWDNQLRRLERVYEVGATGHSTPTSSPFSSRSGEDIPGRSRRCWR